MGDTHPLLRVIAMLVVICSSILYLSDPKAFSGPRLFSASGLGTTACAQNSLLISTHCKSNTARVTKGAVFVSAVYR